jgi:hypothetical protein
MKATLLFSIHIFHKRQFQRKITDLKGKEKKNKNWKKRREK